MIKGFLLYKVLYVKETQGRLLLWELKPRGRCGLFLRRSSKTGGERDAGRCRFSTKNHHFQICTVWLKKVTPLLIV